MAERVAWRVHLGARERYDGPLSLSFPWLRVSRMKLFVRGEGCNDPFPMYCIYLFIFSHVSIVHVLLLRLIPDYYYMILVLSCSVIVYVLLFLIINVHVCPCPRFSLHFYPLMCFLALGRPIEAQVQTGWIGLCHQTGRSA